MSDSDSFTAALSWVKLNYKYQCNLNLSLVFSVEEADRMMNETFVWPVQYSLGKAMNQVKNCFDRIV